MLRTRRARWAVIAVSAVISLACVLWWADRAELLPGRAGDAEAADGGPAATGTGDAATVDGEVIPLGAATYSLAGPGAGAGSGSGSGSGAGSGPDAGSGSGSGSASGAASGRLELALVATAEDAPERILERRALFDDAVIATLLTYTAEDLRSADGADQLRGELLRHARELYPDLGIERVLITGLQVQ